MSYIDGFVAAVRTVNKDAFIKHAEEAATVFKEHGALKAVECWGDDVPDGEVTSFPLVVKLSSFRWKTACRGLHTLPAAAQVSIRHGQVV